MTLDAIFNPRGVALIGATNNPGSVGYGIFKNLANVFKGSFYPVNPKRSEIDWVKCYPSVAAISGPVDLVVIATPSKTVPQVLKECGEKGVKGAVIITAGFKEAGPEGEKLFEELKSVALQYKIRVIGPNCLGFIRPANQLNASFASKMALPGKIAFISQSGALCTAVLDWSIKQGVGFNYFVSLGSMVDVGFHDLIDYFGKDPETSSILIYMETLTEARKFLSAARQFARTKPIVVLKAGRSAQGAKAAMSHTGSLAGDDTVFEAAFKRAGILRVSTIGELFDCAETLAMQKKPAGKRLCILTNAGGPGVIATDYLMSNGGELAKLSDDTIKKLNDFLPATWSHGNPVDIIGDADPERYRKAAEVLIGDKNVDGLLVVLTPQSMTNPTMVAEVMVNLPNRADKTFLASWMGGDDVQEGRNVLQKGCIPTYLVPENAVRSFINLHEYSRRLELLYETPASIPHAFTPRTDDNRALIMGVISEGRSTLTELESKTLLSNYEIPVTRYALAKTPKEAGLWGLKIGFPVVMKIASPDILHKTDVGGVVLNVKSADEARQAFEKIMSNVKKKAPMAHVHGILVEQMASKKYELIIGSKKDNIFGPVIVFGMGGVAVEVFKDTNAGLPPLNMALAQRIIEETKIYTLLKGYRGMPGVDISSIQFLLYKFAYLLSDFPEIKEIDINPFAVDETGGFVLDAKVVLDPSVIGKATLPYSHLVISPYPKEYVGVFRMKNGIKAILRPIKPEDEPLIAKLFTTFSEDTQRFRFFKKISDINHELLIRYTQNDYDRELAIVAEIEEGLEKRIAGVARLISEPFNGCAEFAVVVGDPWHNQGLGAKLTDFILEIAHKRGVSKVCAKLLRDNDRIVDMFRKRSFTIKDEGGDTLSAYLDLNNPPSV